MAADWDEQERQRRELEEIRRSFAEMGARMGSMFEPADPDQDGGSEPQRPAAQPQARQQPRRPRPEGPWRHRAGTPDASSTLRKGVKQASLRPFFAELGRRIRSVFRAPARGEKLAQKDRERAKAYLPARLGRRRPTKGSTASERSSEPVARPSGASDATEQPWFLTDEPIRDKSSDEFHHQDVAEQLKQIVEAANPPDVIGIIGPFGTGKSSVGELLVRFLEGNTRRIAVRLSADKHTGVERQRALVYGLADVLLDNKLIDEHRRERLLRPLAASTQRATVDRAVLGLMLRLAFLTTALVYLVGSAVDYFIGPPTSNPWAWPTGKPWKDLALPAVVIAFILGFLKLTETFSRLEGADEIERAFRTLIAGCRKSLERLVIIVDDIDRLPPNHVLEAVTTIRSFKHEQRRRWERGSERPRVVFIIACDEAVLRQALADADPPISSVAGSTQLAAAEYFEKLFAVRLYMPPHLLTSMRAYARKRLEDVDTYSREAALQAIPILIHPGVKTPRHVIRLVNAFVADFRLALAREQQSERIAKNEVTKHPAVLGRLTVLRIDFPTAYRQIAEDPALLPALDAYIEDPLSLDETTRERVHSFFQSTSPPEGDRSQATSPTAESSETAAYLIPPPHCRTVIEFLRATSDAATSRSLEPFFYLGQAPNAVILGGTVFSGIRDALQKGNASELSDLLLTVRGEPKSIQAAFNTIIEEVNSVADAKTFNAYVRVCTKVLVQPSLTPIEECQQLVHVLVSRVAERPQIEVPPDALAELVALSPPSRVQLGLMDRLADFDQDYESSTRRALAIYKLALLERPERFNFQQALTSYFRTLIGAARLNASMARQNGATEHHAGLASIAEDWLRMIWETDQLRCDELLGEDLYLFVLEMIVKEADSDQRLRPAIGLGELVRLSERARRSRRLNEMAWTCLGGGNADLRYCAVGILRSIGLWSDSATDIENTLLPAMTSGETYPETVLDIAEILIEWSATVAASNGAQQDTEALRKWASEMESVADNQRRQLVASLTAEQEDDDWEPGPDSLIPALLQVQTGQPEGTESLHRVLGQLPSIDLSSNTVSRAIAICNQLISRHLGLEESAYEPVYGVMSYLLQSTADRYEARRLTQIWWRLLHSGEAEASRRHVITGLNRIVASRCEDVEDLMSEMADELCRTIPVSRPRRGFNVEAPDRITSDRHGATLEELAAIVWPPGTDLKVLELLEERWDTLDPVARSIVVEGVVASGRSASDLSNELRQDMIEHLAAMELSELRDASFSANDEVRGPDPISNMCDVVRFLWPYMTNQGRASLVGRHYTSLGCLKEIVAGASVPEFAAYLQHTSRRDDFDSIVQFLKDSSSEDVAASARLGEAAARTVSRFLYENMPYGVEAVQTVVQHLFTTTEAQRTYDEVTEFLRRTGSPVPVAGAVDGLSKTTTGAAEDGFRVVLTRVAEVVGALEGQYLDLAPPHLWEAADGVLTLDRDEQSPLDEGSA